MRFLFLLLAATLAPLLGVAQPASVPGTYELADGTTGTGMLSYRNGYKATLLVKDAKADPATKAGKKGAEFPASKVRAFTMAGDPYVLVRRLQLDTGLPFGSKTFKDVFAKRVVEGKLELLEFKVTEMTSTGISHDRNGLDTSLREPMTSVFYVLRRQGDAAAVSLPVIGKRYREVLTSFLAGRPDLIKKVGPKPTTPEDLFDLIKAFNAGQ